MNRRVLLVEDDASITRFIGMALEDLGVDLVLCADVECALVALQEQPARLIITDLMLPGLSGFDLLRRLQADPALHGAAKVAIFSAGINAAALAQLEPLPVWRILRKPASVAQLQGCVQDALAGPAGLAPAVAQVPAPAGEAVNDADAIATYFAGNAALFHAYRAKCLVQFAHDLVVGDGALGAGDLPALQRLSHSLATVFCTLGWQADSAVAKGLEASAAQGDAQACAAAWHQVRARLAQG
ncbi:MAG: response regulator [Pseudomonadota bacterium]